MGRKLDIDTLSQQFERFDFDGSGALDEREYEQLAKSSLLSKEQAARLWSVLDKNDDGLIRADEFREGFITMMKERAWLRHCPTCRCDTTPQLEPSGFR